MMLDKKVAELLNEQINRRFIPKTDQRIGHAALFEKHQGRNAHDAEVLRKLRLLIHIHLGNNRTVGFGRDLLENRRKHPARSAPRCPEIPKAEFFIGEDDEITAVYAYCNLHGLWKA